MTTTDAALLAAPREEVLASFPLSRVSEAFFHDMLGVLPPAHIAGVPGFFVIEAVSEDIHAQFVAAGGRVAAGRRCGGGGVRCCWRWRHGVWRCSARRQC